MSAVQQQHQTTSSLNNLASITSSGNSVSSNCLPVAVNSVTKLNPTGTTSSTTAAAAANLPAGTTISPISVKQERHDEAEIQEMAAKMLEAQKAAAAKQAAQQQQLANRTPASQPIPTGVGGQVNILNYLTRKPNNPNGNSVGGGAAGVTTSSGSSNNNSGNGVAQSNATGQVPMNAINNKPNPNSNNNSNNGNNTSANGGNGDDK